MATVQVLRKNLAVSYDNGTALLRGGTTTGGQVLVEGTGGVNRVQLVRNDNAVAVGEVNAWSKLSGGSFVEVARAAFSNNDATNGAGVIDLQVKLPAGVLTTTLKLDEKANVVLGAAALATTATDGFVYVPTAPGTPTGVPSAFAGRAPVVVDTTNNKLWFRSGGAWVPAGGTLELAWNYSPIGHAVTTVADASFDVYVRTDLDSWSIRRGIPAEASPRVQRDLLSLVDGDVVIGSGPLTVDDTHGFLFLPSVPGVPTAVADHYAGRNAITWDNQGESLYVRSGGTWAKVGGTDLSSLGTGLVKITGGVPSIAVAGTDYLAGSAISIATGQVAFATAANVIGGHNDFVWDNTAKSLTIRNAGAAYATFDINAARHRLVFTQSNSHITFGAGAAGPPSTYDNYKLIAYDGGTAPSSYGLGADSSRIWLNAPIGSRFYTAGTEIASLELSSSRYRLAFAQATSHISFGAGTAGAPSSYDNYKVIAFDGGTAATSYGLGVATSRFWINAPDGQTFFVNGTEAANIGLVSGRYRLAFVQGTSHITFGAGAAGGPSSYDNYKIIAYDGGTAATSYGLGVEASRVWYNAPTGHRFYVNGTEAANLDISSSRYRLAMVQATSHITFGAGTAGPPSSFDNYKLIAYEAGTAGASFGLGVESSRVWLNAPLGHRFYVNGTEAANIELVSSRYRLAFVPATSHITFGAGTAGPPSSYDNYKVIIYDTGSAGGSYGIGADSGRVWVNAPTGHRHYVNGTAAVTLDLVSSRYRMLFEQATSHISFGAGTAGTPSSYDNYKLIAYDGGTAATSYGLGAESSRLWFNAPVGHRFYVNGTEAANFDIASSRYRLSLVQATSHITFGAGTSGLPTSYDNYKIIAYDAGTASGSYGFGVDSSRVWYNAPTGHRFYAGGTQFLDMTDNGGNGALLHATYGIDIKGTTAELCNLGLVTTTGVTRTIRLENRAGTIAGQPEFQFGVAGAASLFVADYKMTWKPPALTGATASTETISFDFDLTNSVQHATGALTTQRGVVVRAPTYSFVGASVITTAATFAVTGVPVAGTNATITDSYAFLVEAGKSKFVGDVGIGIDSGGFPLRAFHPTNTGVVSSMRGFQYASGTTSSTKAYYDSGSFTFGILEWGSTYVTESSTNRPYFKVYANTSSTSGRDACELLLKADGAVRINGSAGSGTFVESQNFFSGTSTYINVVEVGTVPGTPVSGSALYADGGALKAKGASGTVTTIAPADPHCPACGKDFVLEWENEKYGHLIVCVDCLSAELGERPYIQRVHRDHCHA